MTRSPFQQLACRNPRRRRLSRNPKTTRFRQRTIPREQARLFQAQLQSPQQSNSIGTDFYRTSDDFSQGLVIEGKGVAMKIGGYVKLDFIQDFNAINNTDIFDVSSIPVGGPQRTNNRMHVRQTRLNFDTRWETQGGMRQVVCRG